MNKYSNLIILFLAVTVLLLGIYTYNIKNTKINFVNNISVATSTGAAQAPETKEVIEEYSDAKTYYFDNFHGNKNISEKFKFLYPSSWLNDGQYFSPEKIEYYDLYSVKAPVYFDLIRKDVYNNTEFKYQIDKSKRKSPDKTLVINGRNYTRYDLVDYGTYGGESAGRVIIYIGPEVLVDGIPYYLVFHYEQKPLTTYIQGNDPGTFDKIVESVEFIK